MQAKSDASDRAVKSVRDPISPGQRWLLEKVLDGLESFYIRHREEADVFDDAVDALARFANALEDDNRDAMASARGEFEDLILAHGDPHVIPPMFLLGDACTLQSGNWHQIVNRLAELDV